MKVLLISANTLKVPYPVYPLGLDYVAGALDSGYQTKIADLNEFSDLNLLGQLIREFSPDIVGLSIRNIDNTDTINSRDYLEDYQNMAKLIRKNSKALLILGGSGFTVFPLEFLKAIDADYVRGGQNNNPVLVSVVPPVVVVETPADAAPAADAKGKGKGKK